MNTHRHLRHLLEHFLCIHQKSGFKLRESTAVLRVSGLTHHSLSQGLHLTAKLVAVGRQRLVEMFDITALGCEFWGAEFAVSPNTHAPM